MSEVDIYYRDLKECEDYETYKNLLPIPYPNDTDEAEKLKEFFESGEKNQENDLLKGVCGEIPALDTKRTETN